MKKPVSYLLVLAMLLSMFCMLGAYSGYNDVSSSAWYAEAVQYVTQRGLYQGTSANTFSPNTTMTRGMFVTVLGRYANVNDDLKGVGRITKTDVNMRSAAGTNSNVVTVLNKDTKVDVLGSTGDWFRVRYGSKLGYIRNDLIAVAGSSQFTDVAYGKYYAYSIEWAYENGIASGLTATTFGPDQGVTRQQICCMLYNYAISAGISLPVKEDKASFNDDAAISSWAKTAVYALQQAGVINGRPNGSFDPSGTATRAEVAALFKQFVDATTKLTVTPPTVTPTPTPTPEEEGTTEEEDDRPVYPETPYYGYTLSGNMVNAGSEVADSYFDDACFIGHSLVVGMSTYFSLPNADFFAVNGISAYSMLSYSGFPLSTTHENEEGETVRDYGTLEEVLSEECRSYGKIYIMLGTNELGPESYHANVYYNSMCSLVDLVKRTQPNAQIYLIATPPVSRDCSIHNLNFTRDNILTFNSKLMQVSTEKNVYYLDAFGLLADENGYLPEANCLSDGIHILSPQYKQLKTYLKTHTA